MNKQMIIGLLSILLLVNPVVAIQGDAAELIEKLDTSPQVIGSAYYLEVGEDVYLDFKTLVKNPIKGVNSNLLSLPLDYNRVGVIIYPASGTLGSPTSELTYDCDYGYADTIVLGNQYTWNSIKPSSTEIYEYSGASNSAQGKAYLTIPLASVDGGDSFLIPDTEPGQLNHVETARKCIFTAEDEDLIILTVVWPLIDTEGYSAVFEVPDSAMNELSNHTSDTLKSVLDVIQVAIIAIGLALLFFLMIFVFKLLLYFVSRIKGGPAI